MYSFTWIFLPDLFDIFGNLFDIFTDISDIFLDLFDIRFDARDVFLDLSNIITNYFQGILMAVHTHLDEDREVDRLEGENGREDEEYLIDTHIKKKESESTRKKTRVDNEGLY